MKKDEEAQRAVEALQDGKRVVWLTGAGLSVASGLLPYRKSRDAVWENFITDWGTIEKFHDDPTVWYREFWWKAHGALLEQAGQVRPNAGHDAITRFVRRFDHHSVITQNIDGLHLVSGTPRERTIEIHGRHDTYCCANPACERAQAPLTGIRFAASDAPPTCALCGTILRPLVLLFDEYYESHPLYRAREARQWLNDADVVVFVGTSFSVGITAMALQAARYSDAKLINVNLDAIDELGFVNVLGPSEQTLPALADAAGV
jgi:NAD-dependent SIR2 family protein deacetylase